MAKNQPGIEDYRHNDQTPELKVWYMIFGELMIFWMKNKHDTGAVLYSPKKIDLQNQYKLGIFHYSRNKYLLDNSLNQESKIKNGASKLSLFVNTQHWFNQFAAREEHMEHNLYPRVTVFSLSTSPLPCSSFRATC